jgi:hypothetical protein
VRGRPAEAGRRDKSARGAEAVERALQRYADRGVFRDFSSHRGRGGRLAFQFTWLMRQPMTLTFEPRTAALTFTTVLPGVGSASALSTELLAMIDERRTRAVPAHKRIDGRRVRLEHSIKRGDLSVALIVRGQHHAYAVQRGLNLVNDLFVLLHTTYPDYLSERFGLSEE